jgi:hypothetical protein
VRQVRESVAALLQGEGHTVQRLTHGKSLPNEFAENCEGDGALFIARGLDHGAKRGAIHSGLDRVRTGGEFSGRGSTPLPAHRLLRLDEAVRAPLHGVGDPIFRDAFRAPLGDTRFEELSRNPRPGGPRPGIFDPLLRCAGALRFRYDGSKRQQSECGG